ncbi:MAG: CHAT domain-containing protein [Hormoscilla sp.]
MKLWLQILSIVLISNALPAQALPAPRPIPHPGMVGDAHPTDIVLLKQGKQLFDAQRFSAAAGIWEQTASTLEAKGDGLHLALTLGYLSLAYQELGQWQQAESAIEKSLSLLQGRKYRQAAIYPKIMAAVLNAKGYLELARGKPDQALETWEKTASYYSKIDDIKGVIGAQINQAEALQSLGMYRQAKKTLKVVEISLQNQPPSVVKSIGLLSLANALRVMGELSDSQKLLQDGLTIAAELEASTAMAAIYLSMGNTALALSQRAENNRDRTVAQGQQQAALSAYREAATLSLVPIQRVEAQLNLLNLLVETQQFDEARRLLSQISSQLVQLPASRRSIYARSKLAQILLQATQGGENLASHRKIAQMLASAIQQGESLKDDRASSYALGKLGELYADSGRWLEAEELTRRGLVKAQGVQAGDISYRWQWQLGRILKAQGKQSAATAAYQAAYETLKSLRSDLVAINPDNPDIRFSFRESVEPVYRELVELLLTIDKGVPPSQKNLLQARQVIESLQLAELDNFFREACLDAQTLSIDEIDKKAASIYGIILSDRIDAIVTLPGGKLRHYSTAVPQQEIEDTLGKLRTNVGNQRLSRFPQRILPYSQRLYDWIIRPIAAELQQHEVETLVFVLDGLLRNIPMGVLHDGQQYLIEKYGIALVPGLQLIEAEPLTRQEIGALTAGLSQARHGFRALPNVELELKQILQQIQATQLLFNQNFTSAALQSQINESPFPVVHIATHGNFSSQAEETFILAYDRPINVKELDNFLRRRGEQASVPIELLVLSACETAQGDDRAVLGLAGVAVRAGARSTLATLWKVSDESTATLMIEFYQQLANPGTSKAEALRRAQISLLQHKQFASPYYWAPYVMVGNWL